MKINILVIAEIILPLLILLLILFSPDSQSYAYAFVYIIMAITALMILLSIKNMIGDIMNIIKKEIQ